MSQIETIKKHLIKKPITTIEAFEKYRITRLSAHIHTLRKGGMLIIAERKSNKTNWWFKYSLYDGKK
jgi:hypothetical protein